MLIEDEVQVYIPADAWANSIVPGPIDKAAELDAMVRDYLAAGGCIHQIAPGISADGDCKIDKRLVRVVGVSQFSASEHMAHAAGKERRNTKRDAELVARIAELLDTPNRALLAKTLGVSDGLVKRLLQEHYPDSPLLHERFDDGPALARVRQLIAEGVTGYVNICKGANVCYKTLKRLESKYKLKGMRK